MTSSQSRLIRSIAFSLLRILLVPLWALTSTSVTWSQDSQLELPHVLNSLEVHNEHEFVYELIEYIRHRSAEEDFMIELPARVAALREIEIIESDNINDFTHYNAQDRSILFLSQDFYCTERGEINPDRMGIMLHELGHAVYEANVSVVLPEEFQMNRYHMDMRHLLTREAHEWFADLFTVVVSEDPRILQRYYSFRNCEDEYPFYDYTQSIDLESWNSAIHLSSFTHMLFHPTHARLWRIFSQLRKDGLPNPKSRMLKIGFEAIKSTLLEVQALELVDNAAYSAMSFSGERPELQRALNRILLRKINDTFLREP